MVKIALIISFFISCSLSHSRFEKKLEECINESRLALLITLLEANKDRETIQNSSLRFLFLENTVPTQCKDSLHRRGYNDGPFP